jgi:hypothetical protein
LHGRLRSVDVRAPPYHNFPGRARAPSRAQGRHSRDRLAFPSHHLR